MTDRIEPYDQPATDGGGLPLGDVPARRAPGQRRSGRRAAAVLALVVALASGGGFIASRDEEPVGLDVGADSLLLPDGRAHVEEVIVDGGNPLTLFTAHLGKTELLVTNWNEAIVGVLVLDRAEVEAERSEAFRDPSEGGDPRYFSWLSLPRRGASHSWLADDDRILVAGSRDLDDSALATFAEEVSVTASDTISLPGDMVGAVSADGVRGPTVVFGPASRKFVVFSYQLDASGAAAMRAIGTAEPASLFNQQTEASCCAPEIAQEEHSFTFGDAAGVITTVTADVRALILEGPSHLVLLAGGGQRAGNFPSDDELEALLGTLEPFAPSDVSAWVTTHS